MAKEVKEKRARLTDKQELFCIEYVLNKGNATEAAKRAGYSDTTDEVLANIGFQNLRKFEVIARIAQLREESGVKTGANVEWLQSILVSAIERCMQNEQIYDSEGNPTGEYRFDSKGLAMNADKLMKLNGWDKIAAKPDDEPTPVKIVAVAGFKGWGKKKPNV